MNTSSTPSLLIDRFGRRVHYLRVSITDRCDFRCLYCMAETMEFLPRSHILTFEEIYSICEACTELGVDKIRVTGGEPLVRKGAIELLARLSVLPGLKELTLTTNGSSLEDTASELKAAGVKRVNVSLDSLQPQRFREITRVGNLAKVLRGLDALLAQGFDNVKLNTVILKNRNHDEVVPLVSFAVEKKIDISFIEEMPLGVVESHSRDEEYYSSTLIKRDIEPYFPLLPSPENTGGPARYWRVAGTKTRVGFISPHSHNFCSTCNRVRLTAEGKLLLCLGNEHAVDLKQVLRHHPGDKEMVKHTLLHAMTIKPERHYFNLQEEPVIFRHMNATGG